MKKRNYDDLFPDITKKVEKILHLGRYAKIDDHWMYFEEDLKQDILSLFAQELKREREELVKRVKAIQIKRTKERHDRQNDRGNSRDNGWNEATNAVLDILGAK